jgi:hypothetical protein
MIPRKWPAPGQGQALRISKETARGLSIAAYFWPADAGFTSSGLSSTPDPSG